MNKLILIGSIFCMSQANADYTVYIPLEQSEGGFLPNNSIIMVNGTGSGTPTTPTEPETPIEPTPTGPECIYDYASNYMFDRAVHEVAPGNFRYTDAIYWNNVQVVLNSTYVGPQLTEYVADGYTYTFAGMPMMTNTIHVTTTSSYEVCRTPI